MTDISNKILKEISNKQLKPKAKWIFRLRESGLWALTALVIMVVGLLASLFWLFTAEVDLGPMSWLTGRPFVYGPGPGFFLLTVIIGAGVLLWNVRQTKQGYKYNIWLIISGIVLFGLVFASIFGYAGLNGRLDRKLSGTPYYQSQSQYMMSVWQRPNEGRIAGEITEIESHNNFSLRDFSGKIWSVSSLNAAWRHGLAPEKGLQIKMIGSRLGNNGFEATDVRPFMPMMNNGQGCGMNENEFKGQGGCGIVR